MTVAGKRSWMDANLGLRFPTAPWDTGIPTTQPS